MVSSGHLDEQLCITQLTQFISREQLVTCPASLAFYCLMQLCVELVLQLVRDRVVDVVKHVVVVVHIIELDEVDPVWCEVPCLWVVDVGELGIQQILRATHDTES